MAPSSSRHHGDLADGRLAFYNFSHAGVRYSAFEIEAGGFPPPGARSPSRRPWALVRAFALASLALPRERRRRRSAGRRCPN